MTPTPPEGFKIIPREWLGAGNPLPDDTVFWGERSKAWLECPGRGERTWNTEAIHATAQPLPCFAVQSLDQGPEHNPDGLTPEQYGAPEWRLLRVGEGPRIGDEVYHGKDSWRTVTWKISGPLSNAVYDTYRRRVAPEPEQARNNALNKLAYEQSGEPRTEAKCCPNPLCGWIPQTYGEAVIGKWIKGDECINYEWDNRTTAENAKWLIELYRAQLAASEKEAQAEFRRVEAERDALAAMLRVMEHDRDAWVNLVQDNNALLPAGCHNTSLIARLRAFFRQLRNS